MANRNIKTTTLILAILLVSTSNVLAFGISTPYYKNYPLEISPGQTKEIAFNLQNCPSLKETCDRKDIDVIISMIEGNEIAEIISGESYLIPFGTANTNIILKVSIPENANIGDSYNVKFSVAAPPESEIGNIQLSLKYTVDFQVIIVGESALETTKTSYPTEEPEKTKASTIITAILIAMLIIALIFWFIKKSKFK